jgi:hypothetical protein
VVPSRVLLAILLVVLALPWRGLAASRDRIYRNLDCGIRLLELPRGWQVIPRAQTGYPHVLLIAEREHARMVLAVQGSEPSTMAGALAEEALRALREQKWENLLTRDVGKGVRLEGELDRGRRLLRQAYVVSDGLAYVLTVVTPREVSERVLHDFEMALQSLIIEPLPIADSGGPPSRNSTRCK